MEAYKTSSITLSLRSSEGKPSSYLLTVTVQIRNQKGDQKELMAAILANCHSISMD